jgi:hypothetical protein
MELLFRDNEIKGKNYSKIMKKEPQMLQKLEVNVFMCP